MADRAVADTLRALVGALIGDPPPLGVEFWDGSAMGPADGGPGTLRIRTPDAIRRLAWSPNELGLGRAYVSGDIDVSGDMVRIVESLRDATPKDRTATMAMVPHAIAAARSIGALGKPLAPPLEEAHVSGWRHSRRRDADAISHHYDVGNDFYRLVLGPSMTYSCARFVEPDDDLATAQCAKHDLICRKLGLAERTGMRLLDVGCGWGSMAIHAATTYGANVVGVTISAEQAALARQRVDEAGVADRVEIRLQDYRALGGERFDAISSIGMSEHVGQRNLVRYYTTLREALVPQGRLLNHAISSVGGSRIGRSSFIGRYVFPDGELIDVGDSVLAMERAGFEVRDVESLREHYATTLRHWVANLERHWDAAVESAGEGRARVWRLYMAGSVVGFTDGGINLHQVLGVVPASDGATAMPRTRREWG